MLVTLAATGPPGAAAPGRFMAAVSLTETGAPEAAAPAAEELSLGRLGIPRQTALGPLGSVAVDFPAPARALAPSGSYVRIFFAHSPAGPAPAGLTVAVNGIVLATVPLTGSTEQGSVVEVATPTAVLARRGANRLAVSFKLPAGGSATLGAQTLLHYQLAAAAGSLAAYPYSLLSTDVDSRARLVIVTPSSPDDRVLGDVLRLVADVARRTGERHLLPILVSGDQLAWLRSHDLPAVVVGRQDRLPAIPTLLARAGFIAGEGGWRAPGASAPVAPDAGVVAALPSPFSSGAPILVASGQTDAAVDHAVGRLVTAPALELTGTGLVATGASTLSPPTPETVGLWGQDAFVRGAGQHTVATSVPVPPADPGAGGRLRLAVASGGPDRTVGTRLEVGLDGQPLGSATVAAGTTAHLQFELPGAGLRPGPAGLVVTLAPTSAADPAWSASLLASGSSLSFPAGPGRRAGLRLLPHPFLDSLDLPATVFIAAGPPELLDAAATALAALGAGAASPPPPLMVRRRDPPSQGDTPTRILVIGNPSGEASLALDLGESGRITIQPPPATAGAGRAGWVEEVPASDAAGSSVLWIGGATPPDVLVAAGALGEGDLQGNAASIPPAGPPRDAPGPRVQITVPAALWLARALPVLAALLVLAGVGHELGRSRSRAG